MRTSVTISATTRSGHTPQGAEEERREKHHKEERLEGERCECQSFKLYLLALFIIVNIISVPGGCVFTLSGAEASLLSLYGLVVHNCNVSVAVPWPCP